MNAFITVLTKWNDFRGRARRSEYWIWALISTIILFVLFFIDIFLLDEDIAVLSFSYSLVITLPTLAVLVRRLHDTGHSGWWWFIMFIPVVGTIVFLVFMVRDSTPGPNKYGPNPKGIGNEPEAAGLSPTT